MTGLPDRSDSSQLTGRILFVCTGNQCRSPMAEALLRAKLPSGSGIVVESAGTAGDGTPPPDEVVGVMADRDLDIAGRPSRRVDPAGLERADLIVAMSREHLMEVVAMHPDSRHRSFTFTDLLDRARRAGGPVAGESLTGWARRLDGGRTTASILSLPTASDVGDPMGGPARGYEETARVLDRLTTELAGFLYPASGSADAPSASPDDKVRRPRWSARRSRRN